VRLATIASASTHLEPTRGAHVGARAASTAKHGLIYIYVYLLKHGGPPADGGHPGGRRTGGQADTPAGSGQGGALCYGWVHMLTLWGKGGHGGSPNAEAGKVHQQVGLTFVNKSKEIPRRVSKSNFEGHGVGFRGHCLDLGDLGPCPLFSVEARSPLPLSCNYNYDAVAHCNGQLVISAIAIERQLFLTATCILCHNCRRLLL
jgi:hypothetical protein